MGAKATVVSQKMHAEQNLERYNECTKQDVWRRKHLQAQSQSTRLFNDSSSWMDLGFQRARQASELACCRHMI